MTTSVTAHTVPKLPLGKVTFNVNREMTLANENQRDDSVALDGDVETGVGSRQGLLNADLLTFAFSIPSFQTVDEIEDRCASMLGVKRDRLRIYSLTPLEVDCAPAIARGAQRIAVEVENSSFSLQAIEEVLKENQELRDQSENPTREIEALRREVIKLRKLLASSEALRHRGQQALQELREEFETLHFELTQTSAE